VVAKPLERQNMISLAGVTFVKVVSKILNCSGIVMICFAHGQPEKVKKLVNLHIIIVELNYKEASTLSKAV